MVWMFGPTCTQVHCRPDKGGKWLVLKTFWLEPRHVEYSLWSLADSYEQAVCEAANVYPTMRYRFTRARSAKGQYRIHWARAEVRAYAPDSGG